MKRKIKPYFELAGHSVYHGDSRELMPGLKEHSVGLTLSDIPYGVEYDPRSRRKIIGDDKPVDAAEFVLPSLRLLRPGCRGFLFAHDERTMPQLEKLPISKLNRNVWIKNRGVPSKGLIQKNTEYYFGFINAVRHKEISSLHIYNGIFHPIVLGKRFHDTQKPVGLFRRLIVVASVFGDTVLDYCAGGGVTAIAAHLTGRRSISIEIDREYCEIIKERIIHVVKNGRVIEDVKKLRLVTERDEPSCDCGPDEWWCESKSVRR